MVKQRVTVDHDEAAARKTGRSGCGGVARRNVTAAKTAGRRVAVEFRRDRVRRPDE